MSRHRIIIWFLLSGAVLGLSSCSERKLHDAQEVVAAADSLRAEGQTYTDSLNLAEAYRTLGNRSRFYPDDYAHACYHYGRLLREKDNPVEAMQVFINATHSRSRDYHILGRIYSNMGSLCHLAGEYDLSYDMYEHSANMFLSSGDTLSYYYALNDMAVEIVEQGKKEETLSLINQIQQQCTDAGVLLRTYETTADLYRAIEKFDSAIYWINQTKQSDYITPLGIIIKAQCFYRLGVSDSALYYAQLILSDSTSIYQDRFNALYIVSHCDSTLSGDSIRDMASQREDIRYYEYEPEKENLTIATILLKQDLSRTPIWPWIFVTSCVLFIIGGCIVFSIAKKKRQHKLLSQQILHLQTAANTTQTERRKEIERQCKLFASSPDIIVDLCWKDYAAMCNVVNLHFLMLARKLQQKNLTEREVRLCILSLLDFGYEEMANLLCYAPNGVGKFKMRTAKKLGTTAKNMHDFLINMVILS